MKLPLLLLASALLLLGCAPDSGCLHGDLEDWCKHAESEPGPVNPESADCETRVFDPYPGTYRCGDFDVEAASGGFTGLRWYWDHATGELVAVEYWTDVNHYCGDFVYWYGRRILDCEPDCVYGESDGDVPACDAESAP